MRYRKDSKRTRRYFADEASLDIAARFLPRVPGMLVPHALE